MCEVPSPYPRKTTPKSRPRRYPPWQILEYQWSVDRDPGIEGRALFVEGDEVIRVLDVISECEHLITARASAFCPVRISHYVRRHFIVCGQRILVELRHVYCATSSTDGCRQAKAATLREELAHDAHVRGK